MRSNQSRLSLFLARFVGQQVLEINQCNISEELLFWRTGLSTDLIFFCYSSTQVFISLWKLVIISDLWSSHFLLRRVSFWNQVNLILQEQQLGQEGITQISLQDEACTSWCPLWGGNRLIHFLNSNISPLKRWIQGKSWSCSPTTSSSRSPSPAWSSSAGGTVWCLSILLEGCTTIIRLSYSWATEYMLFLL